MSLVVLPCFLLVVNFIILLRDPCGPLIQADFELSARQTCRAALKALSIRCDEFDGNEKALVAWARALSVGPAIGDQ